ncbi:MAG: DUF5752 family protein [Elusimicrobiales bacterium]|nr:DUF5752 family protein [Elusimicrobiales bacterium]
MTEIRKATAPFRFYTRLQIAELTGRRSSNLQELTDILRDVNGSSIYHHTHRFLQQHQFLSPEPPNDFAYWIAEELGEVALAERLYSLDIMRFDSIRALREAIIATIEGYVKSNPMCSLKFAAEGREFHFLKSISFIMPTRHEATDLREFADILSMITVDSIYYHVFESRLRLEKGKNDFSKWFEECLDDRELAALVERLDPYTQTLEDLRRNLLRSIERSL